MGKLLLHLETQRNWAPAPEEMHQNLGGKDGLSLSPEIQKPPSTTDPAPLPSHRGGLKLRLPCNLVVFTAQREGLRVFLLLGDWPVQTKESPGHCYPRVKAKAKKQLRSFPRKRE
jgi:hypothetical protein